ncbi:hypothetical protein [Vagococcus sp. WN89Y]|uniref:hypothetical protein n=1 Tax=Vagococcus sp. WN89Y TaxID=3457258 RepID=UPI003FCD605F
MQRNINGVINTTGKIKSKNHSPDVPDGCMKKNTASAKTTGTGFIKPEHRHVHEDSPGIFTNFKNQSKICFYKCTETVVKQPEKMIDQDDAKLYASSQEFTPHEIVDDKDDVEPVEDSEDAVEEMGEGSDDGSGFFLGYQNRVCNEKDERVGQKTQRHDPPRQGGKVAVPAECRSELAAPAVGSAENKPQYQEKLKFKALYLDCTPKVGHPTD